RAGRAARRLDVFGYGLPQIAKTSRIGIIELSGRHRAQTSRDELRPQPDREQIERRHAEAERPRRTAEPSGGSRRGGYRCPSAPQLWVPGANGATRRNLLRKIVR